MGLWMIRSGHACELAQIVCALVDSGGLSLASQAENGILTLREVMGGPFCQELVGWAPVHYYCLLLSVFIAQPFVIALGITTSMCHKSAQQ